MIKMYLQIVLHKCYCFLRNIRDLLEIDNTITVLLITVFLWQKVIIFDIKFISYLKFELFWFIIILFRMSNIYKYIIISIPKIMIHAKDRWSQYRRSQYEENRLICPIHHVNLKHIKWNLIIILFIGYHMKNNNE